MQIAKLLGIDDVGSFKLHAARFNQVRRPLDVFLEDKQEWNQWNSYFGKRHEFNRPFLLSLIDFYPEKNVWLFGGCLLYTSPSPRDLSTSRMPSSA